MQAQSSQNQSIILSPYRTQPQTSLQSQAGTPLQGQQSLTSYQSQPQMLQYQNQPQMIQYQTQPQLPYKAQTPSSQYASQQDMFVQQALSESGRKLRKFHEPHFPMLYPNTLARDDPLTTTSPS
ncbi:hypothetical protein CEXT_472681 [Caerostris extrusa]|uniref:Uncharacterized protein n=1 Tax=Caerostris extrusa TaxID=172846 RepID=A0AAV4QYC3_CAEEX|nr:hypothetical protein CEXT_472681 [Caerostris extrusa]